MDQDIDYKPLLAAQEQQHADKDKVDEPPLKTDRSEKQMARPDSRRARVYLTGIFILCYFSWVAVHA